MRIQTLLPDDEFMDDCVSLTYLVEFGELHERDKYQWVESIQNSVHADEEDEILFRKTKNMDFEFKMNHIKQTIKLEIVGNFKQKRGEVSQKPIFCGFYSFARLIRKSGTLMVPNSVG
jgi:hypothetical protein